VKSLRMATRSGLPLRVARAANGDAFGPCQAGKAPNASRFAGGNPEMGAAAFEAGGAA
jgi:hypothetical protein